MKDKTALDEQHGAGTATLVAPQEDRSVVSDAGTLFSPATVSARQNHIARRMALLRDLIEAAKS